MSLTINRGWIFCIPLVFLIKFVIFVLDPLPGLFLGDSLCYLGTALMDWIPPDRSFTYGSVINWSAVRGHSLASLIAIQVFASGLSAVLLAYALERIFSVSTATAIIFGVLCSLEPIQLLYERYVMTEAISLFIFALYMVLSFEYIRGRSIYFLCIIQLLGILLVSFRLSYLPFVLTCTPLLPFLMTLSAVSESAGNHQPAPGQSQSYIFLHSGALIRGSIHFLVALLLTFSLHTGYKHIVGTYTGEPPAYNTRSGYFQLALWAPVVKPEDFPDPELRAVVFDNLPFELTDRLMRNKHLFDPDGLVDRIQRAIPDPEGNRVATKTATNALKRDPFGIATLGIRTFLDYFDIRLLREKISNDMGTDREIPNEPYFKKNFFFTPEELPNAQTLTRSYYRNAIPWYWLLLFSPILLCIALLSADRRNKTLLIPIAAATGSVICTSTILSVFPIVRYLHPLGWLVFLVLGILYNRMTAIFNSHGERRHSSPPVSL